MSWNLDKSFSTICFNFVVRQSSRIVSRTTNIFLDVDNTGFYGHEYDRNANVSVMQSFKVDIDVDVSFGESDI